jgi:uncharacterized membrane protein
MNWAHLHLILNHLPVLGTMFGLGILAYGLWKRSEDNKRLALGLLVITALLAIPAYLTGEPAEGAVKGLAGVAGDLIERHEEAAGVALGGVLALGLFAVVGLVAFRGQRPVAKWFAVTALLGALVVSGLMAWTANLGGQVHHPEIRGTVSQSSAVKGHHD